MDAGPAGTDVPIMLSLELLAPAKDLECGQTAIDCGLFHCLASGQRATYAASLREALAPGGRAYLLCWSRQAKDPARATIHATAVPPSMR